MALPYLRQLLYRSGYLSNPPRPSLTLSFSILRLFLSKTFFVCQFQERFPLSVIKCSVAVINLFRSIVDGATKLKCIDIEKLIIKKKDEERQNWHKERQYLALAFLLYAKFYRIVNAEIKYFRKKANKITKSNKKKRRRNASKQFQNIFVDSGSDQTATQQPHTHTHAHAERLSLFAHESMLHTLRQQTKRV